MKLKDYARKLKIPLQVHRSKPLGIIKPKMPVLIDKNLDPTTRKIIQLAEATEDSETDEDHLQFEIKILASGDPYIEAWISSSKAEKTKCKFMVNTISTVSILSSTLIENLELTPIGDEKTVDLNSDNNLVITERPQYSGELIFTDENNRTFKTHIKFITDVGMTFDDDVSGVLGNNFCKHFLMHYKKKKIFLTKC